jgi:hypothetical protein
MGRQLIPTNTKREDCIQTPRRVAGALIQHFYPTGKILEPCKGEGNFIKEIEEGIDQDFYELDWCEIIDGKDFFNYNKKVDWIITNPPYSKLRRFLQHSLEIADNIVFLTTINHLWLRARIRDIEEADFGIKEIVIFNTPENFPQTGFQIGAFHLQRGYKGDIKFGRLFRKEGVMPLCITCKTERVNPHYKKGKVCDSCRSKIGKIANLKKQEGGN